MKFFFATRAVIEHQGKILLMRESKAYDGGTNTGRYDIVGGKINPDEFMYDGLRREVMEESGLEISIGEIFHIADKFQDIKGETCHFVRAYFPCTAETDVVKLSTDHDDYVWIEPHEHTKYDMIPDEHTTIDMFIKKCFAV